MHALISSFHSAPRFRYDRVGTVGPSVTVNGGTSSTSKLDFNPCWTSPAIVTSQSFDSHSGSVRVTRSRSKETKKGTFITTEETDESQRMMSSALKRFSVKELENIVQSQLEKVVSGHRYNTWLREQVNDADAQLVKYQNRIDALQKHVNDLSVVIHKHTKGSEGQVGPPMKLTRNVGLQVRNKHQPDRKAVYEVEDVQQLAGNTSSGEKSGASVDVSVSSTTTRQVWPTPTSTSAVQKDQHCTVKTLKVCGQVESHQTSSLPVEIDLTELDEEPTIDPSPSSILPIDQTAFLLSKRPVTLCSQPEGSSVLISSPSCVTPPPLPVAQAVDFTIDRTLPWVTSDNVRLDGPLSSNGTSVNPTENSSMGRSPSPKKSYQSAGFSHSAGSSTTPIHTATKFPTSHEIAALISPTSVETYPPAGSSFQNAAAPKKNPPLDLYSHPDRKRRLACRITSFDASTIASVEKYHKLIKKHWYNSRSHYASGLPPLTHPLAIYERRMHQLPNCRVNSREIAPSVVANGAKPAKNHRMPILKRRQQQAFEKRVKSVGIYRTWKLPLAAGLAQKVPSTQHPPPLKPQAQQVQQCPKEPTSIPPPLIDILEDSLTRKTCVPDLRKTSPSLLRPAPMQQELRTCGSLASPTLPDGYPAQLKLAKLDSEKRNLPDLIAISDEGMAFQSHKLTATKVYDLDNLTMFKPILKLTRSEEGIRVEWTIPTLPPDQLDQIESYLLYSRKENEISPSMNTPWFKAAVISALPLPMCFKLTELTAGYRYHFQIGPVLRWCQSAIPFSNPVSIHV
ncbi:uncharacterized protein LOC116931858 [Daphnia magna]|uniref:Activating transcription factor 7-interacting protein Fn3 domain-containing protein n=1 Tax=Daphnia magna TaxID=35525 RepID=A0ABQ9ZMR6_9CRUS|nr:uncharacterized protein LOC116931858 [Daphnia magna]KAK4014161.1 hypothetical protein OUZ56_026698 [Daphnia magna]